MTPRRGVRFSEQSAWEVPAFSPTQVPKKERVLHSIFSPSYHKEKTRAELTDAAEHEKAEYEVADHLAGPKTPARKPPQAPGADVFHTPKAVTSRWRSPQKIAHGKDGDIDEGDVCFSPLQPNDLSPLSLVSGLSGPEPARVRNTSYFSAENPNSTSFETLHTIDMLNFKFVDSCESVGDLKRVVNLLSEQNESPHLFKAARDRLNYCLHKKNPVLKAVMNSINESEEAEEGDSPGTLFFNRSTANISRISLWNTTHDTIEPSKSTLNFSLSPNSVLQGIDLVESPATHVNTSGGEPFFLDSKTCLQPISERSRKRTPQDAGSISEEVKELSTKAMELETSRSVDQESFIQKLEDLEKAKREAEVLVKSLQGKVVTADSQKQELAAAMEKVQKEQLDMRHTLEKERAALCQQDEQARALEKRLHEKITDLTQALEGTKEKSRLVVGAERSLRTQREKELAEKTRRSEELNRMLHETRDDLEKLRRRHAHFRLELLRAMGAGNSELLHRSQQDFITSVSSKIKALKEENEGLSKNFKEREACHSKIVEDRDRTSKRLAETLRSKTRLEQENMKLGKKIQELADEVASSRAYIDKLLKTSHDTKVSNWEEREDQYKSVIQNLRQQIRKQTPAVSIDLYKAAIDDGRQKQSELRTAEQKISSLESKLTQLEQEKKSRLSTPAAKTPGGKVRRERSALFSPTDFLEQGLLVGGYEEGVQLDLSGTDLFSKSPSHQLKSQPPAPQIQHSLGLNSVAQNVAYAARGSMQPVAQKEQAPQTYHRSSEKPPSEKHQQRHGQASLKPRPIKSAKKQSKSHTPIGEHRPMKLESSLTGLKISFQKETTQTSHDTVSTLGFEDVSEMNSHLPRKQLGPLDKGPGKTQPSEDDVLAWVDNYASSQRHPTQAAHESRSREKRTTKATKPMVRVRKHPNRDENGLTKSDGMIQRKPKLMAFNDSSTQKLSSDSNKPQRRYPPLLGHVGVVTGSQSDKVSDRMIPHQTQKPAAPYTQPQSQKENLATKPMPKSASKSSTRMLKVRQIGGRKALQDKLKKMRSPTLQKTRPLNSVF